MLAADSPSTAKNSPPRLHPPCLDYYDDDDDDHSHSHNPTIYFTLLSQP